MGARVGEAGEPTRTPLGARHLLLTGPSGVGKSTLLARVDARLPELAISARGTTSRVIVDGGERAGWTLHDLTGEGGILAHRDLASPHRLGRYGVDMACFHRVVLPQLVLDSPADVHLIDEIGAIAPWSEAFMAAMDRLLDSGRPVVAIVGRNVRHAYPGTILARGDCAVWAVTEANRDELVDEVVAWIVSQQRCGVGAAAVS